MADSKVQKSEAEWRKQLSPEQYRVTREKGTEPAFTGQYWNHKRTGRYLCVACGTALFGSDAKYDSGSGWPSFWEPAVSEHVATAAQIARMARSKCERWRKL